MKTIVYIVIAIVMVIMTFVANNANAAEMDVQKYVLDTVPGISVAEANSCADAHRNGGEFITKSYKITLKCSKNTIIKDWDRD